MLQNRANTMLKEGIEKVQLLGIKVNEINPEVKINTRARRYGRCKREKDGSYTIEINHDLLEQNEKMASETIVHEILHACVDAVGHGAVWKEYARIFNSRYGTLIKTTGTDEEKGMERVVTKSIIKYKCECSACGNVWEFQKMTSTVKNPEEYRCKCGGRLKRTL